MHVRGLLQASRLLNFDDELKRPREEVIGKRSYDSLPIFAIRRGVLDQATGASASFFAHAGGVASPPLGGEERPATSRSASPNDGGRRRLGASSEAETSQATGGRSPRLPRPPGAGHLGSQAGVQPDKKRGAPLQEWSRRRNGGSGAALQGASDSAQDGWGVQPHRSPTRLPRHPVFRRCIYTV